MKNLVEKNCLLFATKNNKFINTSMHKLINIIINLNYFYYKGRSKKGGSERGGSKGKYGFFSSKSFIYKHISSFFSKK